MARDGAGEGLNSGSAFSCLGVMANTAPVPTLRGIAQIVWCKLMSFRAVCSRQLLLFFGSKSLNWFSPVWQKIGGKNQGQRKSTSSPINNGVCFNASLFGQLYRKITDSFDNNVAIGTLISGLFFSGGPATVFRTVVTIIVDAFNRHAWWSWRHISLKSRIVVDPAVAYLDASTAVVFIHSESRVVASMLHPLPNGIKGRGDFEWHDDSPRMIVTLIICQETVGAN